LEGRSVEENKNKNLIKYAIIYAMIKDLLEERKIDKETANKINEKCAADLECRIMIIR